MKGVSGLRYDYGQFYASKTFFDSAKNRRILWGWINESCIQNDDVNKGWSGLQADVEISFEITDLEKAEMPDSSWTNPQLLCHPWTMTIDKDKTTNGTFLNVDPVHEKLSRGSLINHSTVESFGVGGKACITARVYPILATDDRAQRYAFNCGN
ncbi:Beta-fructofuranosidase insoluble isoenzyme CWINV1 [Citrus sinensis]|nr:Beta-fructofuranosidase insoluble isoenzyme CWINV1 [Citrus sinensis]